MDITGIEEPDITPEVKPESESKISARKIGRWGEEYVFRVLTQDYTLNKVLEKTDMGARIPSQDNGIIELIWLNIKKDIGMGYDIVIKENGVVRSYIEVKSTSENQHQLFSITGTQWEFARKLFDGGQGHKYWIYCVFNAGKNNCRIETVQDPIKLWKEGKLYAHPVNFKL